MCVNYQYANKYPVTADRLYDRYQRELITASNEIVRKTTSLQTYKDMEIYSHNTLKETLAEKRKAEIEKGRLERKQQKKAKKRGPVK